MPAHFNTRHLIDTISIQRTAGVSVDERGVESDSWVNASSDVKCRLIKTSESENRDGRNTVVQTFGCVVPGNTDVKASDRVFDGTKYYEIQSVIEARKRDGVIYYKNISLLYRE